VVVFGVAFEFLTENQVLGFLKWDLKKSEKLTPYYVFINW